ncbi:MAG: molybdopterin-dependent oxidoreductase, partial [Candidatus Hodarchaeota archaeon]
MSANEIIKSTCGLCANCCGVLIHVEDGKPVKIEGDLSSPVSGGALCVKGSASLEYLYHPDRLKYPLKRKGDRGKGEWQQISWEEALSTLANELIGAREKHGAESVIVIRGGFRGLQDHLLARLANAFGTPNFATMSSICKTPRVIASRITYGFYAVPDYEYPPACIMIWGANKAATNICEYEKTIRALDKGSRLIIIDPLEIALSERADLCLRLRPGSDLALALGMIKV